MSETTPETGATTPDPERKGPYWNGHRKGYEEGYAKAQTDASDAEIRHAYDVLAGPTDEWSARDKWLYEIGYDQARKDLAAQHRPPLFEACKRTAREPLSEKQLESAIAVLEHEYGTLLNKADRDLILGLGRRTRLAAQAAPERPVPTVSHETGKRPPETGGDTDYQLVQ